MKNIGVYLAIFGFGSMLLALFDMNFKFLMWIDNWGETAGWAIRGGAGVLGVVLFIVGNMQETKEEPAEEA